MLRSQDTSAEVGSTVVVGDVQVEVDEDTEEIDAPALGQYIEDLSDSELISLFEAVLKVDALERGANGWKFTEAERTVLGTAQSAARLAGL